MFNKSQIMKEAHRQARGMMEAQSKEPSWATKHSYAQTLSWSLRSAWREAREAFRPNNKKIKQLENKVLAIKCGVNRLQPHHWNKIKTLESEIQALAA